MPPALSTSLTPAPPAPPGAAAAAAPGMLRRDFPGWLPPMLVKELRQGLRTRGFVGALVLFQLVMFVATLGSLGSAVTSASSRTANSALSAFFWTILIVQLLLVTPTRAVGGLQAEVDARNLDLLVLTRLNAWRIVLGKWLSLLAQAALLLVAMLPYLIVRYFTDNADIAGDLGRCLIMLGASALLTAAGLWASGVARALRVVIVILLAATLPTVAGGFGPTLFGRSLGSAGSPWATIFEPPFDLVNAALLGAFFLVSAVRNIAPPAENHGFFVRSLPVVAFIPALLAAMYGAHSLAVRQLYIAGAFLALVCLFELASARLPMASHWAGWRRRGPLWRAVGRCSLPGWQSALWHALGAAALWIAIALLVIPAGTVASRELAERVAWLAVLAVTGLIFPAALRELLPPAKMPSAALYLGGLILPVILSWAAIWLAESKWKLTALRSVMEVLPVSNFLFVAGQRTQPAMTTLLQVVVSAFVLGLALWQARPYWSRVDRFGRQPLPEERA